jgi:hypothetical protein
MYVGPVREVTLQFDFAIINAIFDKFGEDTQIIKTEYNHYLTTVKVQTSPALL